MNRPTENKFIERILFTLGHTQEIIRLANSGFTISEAEEIIGFTRDINESYPPQFN